jgi:hypothetical protein
VMNETKKTEVQCNAEGRAGGHCRTVEGAV